MKRIIALIIVFCMLFSIGGVTVFAGTPIFDVTDHWKKNVVIFYNVDDIFNAASICYCAKDSENWQSAEMTYGGKNEFNQDSWYFTMPEGKYLYYITDGTHRTKEEYFTGEILLYLLNETDKNGNYDLYLDWISSDPEPPYLYKARFEQTYSHYDGWNGCYEYKELYYHTDQNGETDWALVYAMLPMCSPIDLYTIIGNRVVHPGTQYEPFEACYGIYDVKNDYFIDAAASEANSYPGFLQTFDKIEDGRLIGDLDHDDEISILDVTILQRCCANMRDFPNDDEYWITFEWGKTRYYSDFNRDGERDLLDATCIQRYLAGLPFKIG